MLGIRQYVSLEVKIVVTNRCACIIPSDNAMLSMIEGCGFIEGIGCHVCVSVRPYPNLRYARVEILDSEGTADMGRVYHVGHRHRSVPISERNS